ncbi:hypothetical protein [Parapedobacter sp. DT-150]|uniref:hypothetical protein n=1 Tax=Parapedobacter sp. DT-150 TaxID=3396162 RepID=UPI003F1BA349
MGCADKNKMIREGTGTYNRALDALSTAYARVDERTIPDMMLFAQRYAALVKYVDKSNKPLGTWERLMGSDISVALATLAALDNGKVVDYQKLLFKRIDVAIRAGDKEGAKREMKSLFDLLVGIVQTVDRQVALLGDEPEYQAFIKNRISGKLNVPFWKLMNFKNQYPELFANTQEMDADAPVPVADANAAFSLAYFAESDDVLPITIPNTSVLGKLYYVAHHNLFAGQVKALLHGISLVVKHAGQLLEKSIQTYAAHEPHYALFLAFLKLFGHAQDSLNSYGQRHLDFYYKDVLRLRQKASEPDQAYLVFDLQKHVNQHVLKAGVRFKGGKDSNGDERQYALTEDLVLNKASVAQLKTTQLVGPRLLASPVAGSADGMGAPFSGDDRSWFAFGDKKTAPLAEVGFGIASNLLFLKEGRRTITLTFTFDKPIPVPPALPSNTIIRLPLSVELTGEKDWVMREVDAVTPGGHTMVVTIELDAADPAIVPYNEKLHQQHFDTGLPLLRVHFKQLNAALGYQELNGGRITSLKLDVAVAGLKDVALSNDGGTLDSAKPFKPFGDFPRQGANFNIGSTEIFQKKLTSLQLRGRIPAPVSVQFLHDNEWKAVAAQENSDGYAITADSQGRLLAQSAMDFLPNEYLTIHSHEGILRLKLEDDGYSLEKHIQQVNENLNQILLTINKETGNEENTFRALKMAAPTVVDETSGKKQMMMGDTPPVLHYEMGDINLTVNNLEQLYRPYEVMKMEGVEIPLPPTLMIDSFAIDYTASEVLSFSAGDRLHHYYHLHPFGYNRVLAPLPSIFPPVQAAGELYIGLSGISSPATTTLFFEMVEGSSNPLKDRAEIQWSYLDGSNTWKHLEDGHISDGTKRFSRSGIVTINLPPDASTGATLLPTGLLWIKAAVAQHTDAVCKLIAVRAQVGMVKLMQGEGVVYRNVLPAKTISKAVLTDQALKRIEQPMDSFGGRLEEPDTHFYMRASERLRHKQRAISLWDYEHIILEKFTDIYKVKCINHAGFYPGAVEQVFCEHLPGHVTIIPIPRLNGRNSFNPLRPYTPLALLADIQEYLNTIKSPFVSVHVKNPQFEELELEFEVKFHEQLDETFYTQQLNLDIERFLCPWAFDEEVTISFAGKIAKSTLINFVDERPYVDYVSSFKMHHIIRDDEGRIKTMHTDVEEASGESARSVLVSHSRDDNGVLKRHRITVIQNSVSS